MRLITLYSACTAVCQSRNNQTTKDIESLMASLTAQSKKNATADLVGLFNLLKQQKAVNLTIPTLQLPKMVSQRSGNGSTLL